MSILPGRLAIQNVIPVPFVAKTAFAARGLGIRSAAIMFGLGIGCLNRRRAQPSWSVCDEANIKTASPCRVSPLPEQAKVEGI
ncbi:MAG: hypothetical protein JJ902_07330 [Roseibium sp.]|nr:hypothetical protein [Roseibium sp.]